MMRHYHEALCDCDAAIRADPSYHNAYLRKAQLQVMNGLLNDAIVTCHKVLSMDPDNKRALEQVQEVQGIQDKYANANDFIESLRKGKDSMQREDVTGALRDIDVILKSCVEWHDAKVLKAEALWSLGHSEEAYDLTNKLVAVEVDQNTHLHILRAIIFVSMGKSEEAILNLRMVLTRDRGNVRAITLFSQLRQFLTAKAEADMAYKGQRYDDALGLYEEAMKVCPEQSPAYMGKLYFNRACTEASLERHEEAIKDCNEAIKFNDDYIKAYMRRAASLRKLDTDKQQCLELAIRDYKVALALCKTKVQRKEIVRKMKDTKREHRMLLKCDSSRRMQRRHTHSSAGSALSMASPLSSPDGSPLSRGSSKGSMDGRSRISPPSLLRTRARSTDTATSRMSGISIASTQRSQYSFEVS